MATSVLVTGANGFIGSDVALAFRAAGYRVYGLVRSLDKATELRKNEIIPVVGTINDPSAYKHILAESAILIDNVFDYAAGKDALAANKILLDAFVSTAEEWDVVGSRKTYIYTSGAFLTGQWADTTRPIDEYTTPLDFAKNNPFLIARREFEKYIVGLTSLTTIVIRPTMAYGKSGSHMGTCFAKAKDDVITIRGDPKRLYSQIHITDLADAYLRAAKAGRRVHGEVFNICTFTQFTYEDMIVKPAQFAGFKGRIEYGDPDPSDFFSMIGNRNIIISPQKAIDMLGWMPRQAPFLSELETHYEAWKAHNPDKQ